MPCPDTVLPQLNPILLCAKSRGYVCPTSCPASLNQRNFVVPAPIFYPYCILSCLFLVLTGISPCLVFMLSLAVLSCLYCIQPYAPSRHGFNPIFLGLDVVAPDLQHLSQLNPGPTSYIKVPFVAAGRAGVRSLVSQFISLSILSLALVFLSSSVG